MNDTPWVKTYAEERIEELYEQLNEIGEIQTEKEMRQVRKLDGRKDELHKLLREIDRRD